MDRKALRERIFNDSAERRRLNQLMRPHIIMGLFKAIGWHYCVGTPLVVLDAPLRGTARRRIAATPRAGAGRRRRRSRSGTRRAGRRGAADRGADEHRGAADRRAAQ